MCLKILSGNEGAMNSVSEGYYLFFHTHTHKLKDLKTKHKGWKKKYVDFWTSSKHNFPYSCLLDDIYLPFFSSQFVWWKKNWQDFDSLACEMSTNKNLVFVLARTHLPISFFEFILFLHKSIKFFANFTKKQA